MGGAILKGALEHGIVRTEDIYVKELSEEAASRCAALFRVETSTEYPDWNDVSTVVLAVKPQVLPAVLEDIKEMPEGISLVSIAAGISLKTLESALPQASWHRVMPNTPVFVGEGMTAITIGTKATGEQTDFVEMLFSAIGEVISVSEADLDRLGALSGAGPGYCFVILDALADAGVAIGLPRSLAIKAAAQTLLGAGKMVKETEMHPAILRDQVTSPGGTTIAGIVAMEEKGLRTAIHAGVTACYERSNELGKKN